MHPPIKDGPSYSSRVLALKEQGFGLAILESEDLAVTADVEFALYYTHSCQQLALSSNMRFHAVDVECASRLCEAGSLGSESQLQLTLPG